MNKVKYGLSNVHYAVATIGTYGTATYGTPKSMPGAVNISLDAQGENTPFYADNVKYYVTSSNTGYEGDLEMAMLSDDFRKDCLGEITDASGVIVEDSDAVAVPFALLFQFEGDEKGTRHVLYNCTATRPQISGATKEDSTEPQTETVSLSCASIKNAVLDKNLVKARCTNSTATSVVYDGWFESVYQTVSTS